jgi:hypothetical protein
MSKQKKIAFWAMLFAVAALMTILPIVLCLCVLLQFRGNFAFLFPIQDGESLSGIVRDVQDNPIAHTAVCKSSLKGRPKVCS